MKHNLTFFLCLSTFNLLPAQPEKSFADVRIVSTSNQDYEDYAPVLFEDGIIYVSEDKDGGLLERDRLYFSRIVKDEELSEPEVIELEGYSGRIGPASYCVKTKEFFFTGSFLERGESRFRLGIYVGKIEGRAIKDIRRLDLYKEGTSVMHPAVSDDGMTMIVSSVVNGNADLYEYTRKKMNDRWEFQRKLTETSTDEMELFPCFAGEGKLVFSRGNPAAEKDADLYLSIREGEGWSLPQQLKALNSEYDEYGFVSTGPYRGYFSSTRNKDGAHLYYFWTTDAFWDK